jgi:hypothetical protein
LPALSLFGVRNTPEAVLTANSDERDAREYVEADLAQSLKPAMNGPFFDAELTEAAEESGVRLVWAA